MGTIYILLICMGIPAIGLGLLQCRKNVLLPFLLGASVFFISQMVLRIPILNLLQERSEVQLFMITNMVFYLVILAVSAGLFEEVGRYIGFMCMPKHHTLTDALAFGLGHGAMEAIVLMALPVLQLGMVDLETVLPGGIERIAAMVAHLSFTLVVWRAVKMRKPVYLLLAIALHAVYDFGAVMMIQTGLPVMICELVLLLLSGTLFTVCWKWVREKENAI